MGYITLGWYYNHHYVFETDKKAREEALEKSMELAQKAMNLDDSLSEPHILLCSSYGRTGEREKAMAECERAVPLDPGSFDALAEYGGSLNYVGRYQEAITAFQKAVRINPMGKAGLFRGFGIALLFDGHVEESISAFKTALQRSPRDIMSHLCLSAAYSWPDVTRKRPQWPLRCLN